MADAFLELESCNSGELQYCIQRHTQSFRLVPNLWENISLEESENISKELRPLKYLTKDERGEESINPEINNLVPNDAGGIYFFCIIPPVFESHVSYLMYIGRAQYSTSHNLRKRVKCYWRDERPKLERLFRLWGDYLYLKWIPIKDENSKIRTLEAKLINSFLPPFNTEIPNIKIRQAVNAFR